MTAGWLPDREHPVPEALLADRYLDDLLAAAERGAVAAPVDTALDPGLRDAADVLRRVLVRVHPSFRFEERLSARLAELAAAQVRPSAATAAGGVQRERAGPAAAIAGDDDPLLAVILAGALDPADAGALAALSARPAGVPRPLLVGGAITSAALSLVGVAWVAWRASRPGFRTSPLLAGRGTRARGLAESAGVGGLGGPA